MSYEKADLISYRLKKAHTSLAEAKSLIEQGFLNGPANRLYYSCFYAVIALLAKEDITARKHNGVRTEFFKAFIKTGRLDNEFSKIYSNLMELRQENDYADFVEYDIEEIQHFVAQVERLINSIEALIKE
jgi:uncharacterized protein (UPF0332 family)